MQDNQNDNIYNNIVDPLLSELRNDPRYEENNQKKKVFVNDSNADIFDVMETNVSVFLNESGHLCRNLYKNLSIISMMNTPSNTSVVPEVNSND